MLHRLQRSNLALIRLVLAVIVLLIHIAGLSSISDLTWLAGFLTPSSPTRAFFVMSGFLVVMSYERARSLEEYAWKRFVRVYPAYAAVVLFFALLLPASYDGAWLRYVVANLAFANFLAPTLPGVFEGNSEPFINGSLWTLKVEVMFYAFVPVLVWSVRRWGPVKAMGAMYLGSVLFEAAMLHMAPTWPLAKHLSVQMPAQLSYFAAGALIYYRIEWFGRHIKPLVLASAVAFPLGWMTGATFVMPAALAVLVMAAGLYCYLGDFGKHGDFSYGIYLVHFPIIQLLVSYGAAELPLAAYVSLTLGVCCLAAFLIWHLIEKRLLGTRLPDWRPMGRRATA